MYIPTFKRRYLGRQKDRRFCKHLFILFLMGLAGERVFQCPGAGNLEPVDVL
jgi:hypothetical protein